MLNNTNKTTNTPALDRGASPALYAMRDEDMIAADVMVEIGNPDLHKSMGRAVERTIGRTNATSDIVQSALVSMIEHAETFDWSKGSILNWGCRIASNLARNWRKASANRNHDSATVATDDSESIELVDTLVAEDGRLTAHRQIERKALAAAINSLDGEAQTFLDAMAGGMGQCEAGALNGWSPATTTRRYRAITAALADKL
jgi:DNA-directed RNA polymerase specialized sigma24 family protein